MIKTKQDTFFSLSDITKLNLLYGTKHIQHGTPDRDNDSVVVSRSKSP
jgi:hypothetical protein